MGRLPLEWFEDLYNRQIFFDLYAEEDIRKAPKEVDGVVKILGLKPGQSILDVCCGYGRHSIELARRGYRVTGIDLSPKQIAVARRRAKEEDLTINFLIGDAREMEFQNKFDITLNLFLSFGYFKDDAENLKMLEKIASATVSNGKFLMDLWNREKEIRDFRSKEVEEHNGIKIEKRWSFDPWEGRLNWENTVFFPDGRRERWKQSIRAYTLVELKRMLNEVGFRLERVFGDLNGSEYTIDSPNMILISRRIGK